MTPPTARPKAVDTAFLLTLAGIVLGSVGTAMRMLVDHEEIVRLVRETLTNTGKPYTDDDVLAMIGPFRVAGAVGIVVFAGLLLLVALKMRAGRNWARIVLVLLALVGMVSFLGEATSSGAALDLIWTLAGVAFSSAAVVYLFRPDSAKFFADHRKRR